ncbi:thermonuclease family protein [Ancylobacter sp. A5.8]|uniref:thermonuclease family protein n=1 Tax=Ancylobacter gelatini TaxID=2919920 RepID=UPI001F4D508B|nr:thermonuclease family protein [Ancylobacter gelatini]MCJ8142941.1 thermonuclease family protein [Ancylobacter gelatini]
MSRLFPSTALVAVLLISTSAGAGIYVTDGDTIIVDRERIRIVGIDAPETRRSRCDDELRRGLEAKARVVELLTAACGALPAAQASCIDIERQPKRDRYGRTLARIRVDGRDLGERLISEGLVRPYICPKGRCPARQPWCMAGDWP